MQLRSDAHPVLHINLCALGDEQPGAVWRGAPRCGVEGRSPLFLLRFDVSAFLQEHEDDSDVPAPSGEVQRSESFLRENEVNRLTLIHAAIC